MNERVYQNRRRCEKRRRQQEIQKRICSVLFTACLVIGLSLSCHALVTKASSASEVIQYKYYKNITVAYGDTLWTLASENYSDEYDSMEDYIFEVKEINHLDETGNLLAGQMLILPYYSPEFK